MTHRLRALVAASLLTLAGLAAAPAALAGDPCYHSYTLPPSTTADTTTVRLDPCAFTPTIARVAPGATVTFENASEFVHLLTGANQEWGDRDKEIPVGGTVTATFAEAGVYPFSCALHRGMTGVIIVGDADEQAAAAAPVASTGSGSESGPIVAIAIIGLAALAALGWATVMLQRRRPVAAAKASASTEAPTVQVS